MLGGDIDLKGGFLSVASGGTVELGSVNDTGEIGISENSNLIFSNELARGDISLFGTDVLVSGFEESSINVYSQNLNLTEGAQIKAGINQIDEFDTVGGNIIIDALGTVSLDDSIINNGINVLEIIFSSDGIIDNSIDDNAEGNTGKIEVSARSVVLQNGGLIIADTMGIGNAGDIEINATESVIVDGESSDGFSSRISSDVFSQAEGNGGKITITTPSLKITNDAGISVRTFGNGDGGEIKINADFVLLEDSAISTISRSAGNAGNIELRDFNTLMLENSSIASNSSESSGGEITIVGEDTRLRGDSDIITNVENGVGGGGDITITADSVIAFDDSDIFAFAGDGTGGNITLNTPVFFGENFTSNSLISNPDFLDNNSRVDLNATGVVSSGAVSIPDVSFIQNSLSELPDNSLNTDELLANSCVVPAGDGERGRFVITGGESLPVRPGDNLPSKYPTTEVRNLPDNNSWQSGDRIVEPQAAYRLTNGKLVLSRECQ